MVVALHHFHEGGDHGALVEDEPIVQRKRQLVGLEPLAAHLEVERHPLVRLVILAVEPGADARERFPEGLAVVPFAVAVELLERGFLSGKEDVVRALVVRVDGHVQEQGENVAAGGRTVEQRPDVVA